VIVLRLAIAALSALILADCGGMHACTSDGVPCGEQAVRPVASAQSSSGGARSPVLLPTATASVASAPFVPPAAFEAPAPAVEPPPPAAPTATVTETTVAAVEEQDEDSGRHHGRHGRHGGRHHRSSSGSSGSHSRHHRRHH
jgi:hypothetical protein